MAHHVEPMEIDSESDFDNNKENAYLNSNVLPRTPCTEKGYEELDVSELNMKLRYSITPAASPMSKSMSHCLDNRYNASTDESLNNTVINENENNLTRSLNSTLIKPDVSAKSLPLQALLSDLVDSNRNSTVLRTLDTTITKDVTITVSNENELDCLSIPSSSSSMTHTPEATTPTKEIPKSDSGSPIMRGLKSVLSMFRSSQSPIPPSEADNNLGTVISPVDVPLPEPTLQAIASTPINQKSKERSLSRRNSPHKESIVFNEDLERDLQWNDDSTILFSSEKIPIHKLFFQDKPSGSKCVTKKEEVNSSVEYMDVSYSGDISINDRTLNGTVNKNKRNDVADSDGEFVDCETTFTQEESQSKTDVEKPTGNITIQEDVQLPIMQNNVTVNPIMDATQDIINLIDSAQFSGEAIEAEKQLDFSSTDIVKQLSELINASEAETVITKNCSRPSIDETPRAVDLLVQAAVQPELLENPVTDLKNVITCTKIAESVSIEHDNTLDLADIVPDILNSHKEPNTPEINYAPVGVSSLVTDVVTLQSAKHNESKIVIEINNEKEAIPVSPVDIPLPIEDDFDKINDNGLEFIQCPELQVKTMPIVETSITAPMSTLHKTTTEEQILHNDYTNCEVPCPPSLLSSDVSLPKIDNSHLVNTNSLPHEAITDVPDPVHSQTIETPDIISSVDNSESIMANENAKNYTVADNNLTIDLVAQVTEEKMEISFIEQNKKNSHYVSEMDISIIHKSLPAEPESINEEYSSKPIEVIQEKNVSAVIDGFPSNEINEDRNNEEHIVSLPLIKTDKELTLQGESRTVDIIGSSTAEKLKTKDSSDMKIVEIDQAGLLSNQPLPNQVSAVQEGNNDVSNTNETCNITDIVNTLNVASTIRDVINQSVNEQSSNTLVLVEMPPVMNIIEVQSNVMIKEDIISTEFPKSLDLDITKTLDETDYSEKHKQLEEKIDEEIVLSESNSPFISMSTENEFDSEVKKDDFEEVENEFSNKHNPSPPGSPKIVSRGYHFNFDDMDSMDPFGTKTKIRMSPPPVESHNTSSLHSLNKNTNINRRKSIPVKKNVLKAKKKINSTFVSSESAPSIDESPDNNLKKDADIKKLDSFILCEENQITRDVVSTPVQDITLPDAKDQKKEAIKPIDTDSNKVTTEEYNDIVSKPLKTSTMIDATEPDVTDHHKVETKPFDSSSNKDMDLNDIVSKPLETSTITEDVIMSDRSKFLPKSDNTSSSEQSTYYSAGTSSTECISKNVFNLPEIDDKDFNPFATKSKIRQTPPPDLDMVNPFATKCNIKSSPETSLVISQEDANATVTIDNENETKGASYNLSDCSSASKTSDDKNVTVQEVHTEDEDTIEGPFLEAEDVEVCEKMSELFDNKEGIVDFNDKHEQAADDNTEAAEMFIDAEAFEFLMNQNNADEVAYSGKESLFLKFDPLFARRVTSEGVASALNELKRRQSTPKKTHKEKELISFEKPVAGPSDLNVTHEVQGAVESHDEINVTMSKPMMVVPPAINPVVTPKTYSTPSRTNRLSMTFTSPAMAVIDRLLSLSGSSPSAGHDATVTHVSREHNEADQALTQLRELLAEKEINVYNLRCESKELKDRLFTLETQMKSLEAESAERLKKVDELNENLAEKTKMNRSMAAVVEEYERTIASLISETEQDKKRYAEERNQLIRERDEQSTHLASMEVSFNDLHSKYEKSKQVIMGYKTNEDAYKNSLKEFEDNLNKMHTNYELLKQHATSKLNHANQELEKLNKAHEAEVLKLNAMIKRKDLHITSLEESLAQKTKANEELTAICDELINKVG